MNENPCECSQPGFCERHRQEVTKTGIAVCNRNVASQMRSYFGARASCVERSLSGPRGSTKLLGRAGPCSYLGAELKTASGERVLRQCPSCTGTVFQKVFECRHPAHRNDPTTVIQDCMNKCADYRSEPLDQPPPQEYLAWRIAHFSEWQSLGALSFKIAQEMEKRGVPVRLASLNSDERFIPISEWVKERIDPVAVNAAPWVLQSSGPQGVIPRHQKVIKLTCQDSDGLQNRQFRNLAICHGVLGLSTFNEQCWKKLGVPTKIGHVPLGIDPEAFHQTEDPPLDPFVFGIAGRMSHGPKRKNIAFVAEVFAEIADQMPGATLKIRTTPGDRAADKIVAHPQIEHVRNITSTDDVVSWYKSLSVYVAASRCESWGMMPHEAMACGRPVIMNPWGGSMDYWTPECGWPLEYVLEKRDDPMDGASGNWASPTAESLKRTMLHVYNNRDELAEKGRAAAKRAAEFTWARSAEALHSFLIECGMLPAIA